MKTAVWSPTQDNPFFNQNIKGIFSKEEEGEELYFFHRTGHIKMGRKNESRLWQL